MASLGDALVNKILGHSDAEKAFRPWWDNLEDFLVYALVMLGIIVAPTSIINGTPLDCNFCRENYCGVYNETHGKAENRSDPQYNAWWVKKYCTVTAVDGFIMYFPYILLIMALVIVLIERVFVKIFKAGLKLNTFYNLLVKQGDGGGEREQSAAQLSDYTDVEHSKTALEVSQSFEGSRSYFLSYLLRTVVEFVLAGVLFGWLLLNGLPIIEREEFIYCNVYGYWFECAGHPQQFYMYVLFVTLFVLFLYLLCCLYNLLWLFIPSMSTLGNFMAIYKRETRRCDGSLKSDEELLGELYNVYYTNWDLKLLLDLLAESSGISVSLRIMSLIDKKFRIRAEPQYLKVIREGDLVRVEFMDAPFVMEILPNMRRVVCIYTVEIIPPTKKSSVVAFKAGKAKGKCGRNVNVDAKGDTEMEPINAEAENSTKKTEFTGLDPEREYIIRVSTVMNGRSIASSAQSVEPEV